MSEAEAEMISDNQWYRKVQLNRIKPYGGLVQVKFDGEDESTNWLNITTSEFEAIRKVLLDGEANGSADS